MARLGCSYKIIVTTLKFGGKILPYCGKGVAVRLWFLALSERRLLNFLTVLVETREKECRLPQATSGACDHVGDDLFVAMAQVWLAIDVIYSCGQVKILTHVRLLWPSPPLLARRLPAVLENQAFCSFLVLFLVPFRLFARLFVLLAAVQLNLSGLGTRQIRICP